MSNELTDDVPDGPDDVLDAALADSDDLLRAHLEQLLSPPADLSVRTAREVTDTLLHRSTLAAAVDTLGVGWRTVRILFGTDPPEDIP
jgi:hypothetical protein